MNPQLRRVLLAENPWLRGEDLQEWMRRFLPGSYIPRRLRLAADHRVVLVVGPRQAGKSTLIWKTLLEAGEPVLYLNCEEPSIREWLSSPAAFLADVAEACQAHRLGERARSAGVCRGIDAILATRTGRDAGRHLTDLSSTGDAPQRGAQRPDGTREREAPAVAGSGGVA